MLPTYLNYTESKSYDNNCHQSNYNGNKIGKEEQRLNNLEGFK